MSMHVIRVALQRGLLAVLAICASHSLTQAQQFDYGADALLFSRQSLTGTARFQGLGGAQTALGGDLGSVAGNPAGVGMFKRSEFSISPAVGYVGTNTSYLNNNISAGKLNFTVPNFGIVFSSAKGETVPGKWRGSSFGISLSRQNNFQTRFGLDGINRVSSIQDQFVEAANRRGAPVSALRQEFDDNGDATSLTALYFGSYLANPFNGNQNTTLRDLNKTYFQFESENSPPGSPASTSRQVKTYNQTGAVTQWNFAWGGNYDDKLYLGASLGWSTLRFGYESQFDESYSRSINGTQAPGGKVFDGITLKENLALTGSGVNLNVGLIYRPLDLIRLGLSFHSPTWYGLTETYTAELDAALSRNPLGQPPIPLLDFDGRPMTVAQLGQNGFPRSAPPTSNYTSGLNVPSFSYNLTTPLRVSGGLAFFLGKKGFISADAEYVDFASIRLRSGSDAKFGSFYNAAVSNAYRSVINLRAGAEYRLGAWRVRGGFNYQPDPYVQNRNNNFDRGTRMAASLGTGIRRESFYVDFTAVYSWFNTINTPYTISDSRRWFSASTTNQFVNGVLTLGFFW